MRYMEMIIAGTALPFTLAHGQFVLVEDLRTIDTGVIIEQTDPDDGKTFYSFEDFNSVSPAVPFGDFDAVSFSRAEGLSPDNQWGQAIGTQTSSVDETVFAGSGSVFTEGMFVSVVPPAFLSVSSSSEYSIRFVVDEPTLVRLEAHVIVDSSAQGSGTFGLARARLRHIVEGPPVFPVFNFAVVGTGDETIVETALLEPGTYIQEFSAQAIAGTTGNNVTPVSASFSGSLVFLGSPCNAADVAEPFGVLDLADVQAFVSAFVNQDPLADLAEPFGVLDLLDVVEFVTSFLGGCP